MSEHANDPSPDPIAPADYGDPRAWLDTAAFEPTGDATGGEEGWAWIGTDEGFDNDLAFSQAAIDALTAGEELLARDLNRLTSRDFDLD